MSEKSKIVKKPKTLGETEGWNGGYDAYDCGAEMAPDPSYDAAVQPKWFKDLIAKNGAVEETPITKTTK